MNNVINTKNNDDIVLLRNYLLFAFRRGAAGTESREANDVLSKH